MTLATMKHQIVLPGGVVGNQVKARVRVIATDDSTDGFGTATADNLAVGGARTVTYDADGLITLASMNPTSGSSDDVIDSPTGCVYELVTTYPDGRSITVHFTVPDSAGPHWVHDYYADPPASVTAQLGHSSLTGRTAASAHPSTAVDHGSHTVSAALGAGAPARPANLQFAGHSYLAASGIGSSAAGRGTAPRVAALLGVPAGQVNNLAKSGAALRAAQTNGAARYLQDLNPGALGTRPLVGHVGVAVGWFGTNDAILGSSSGLLDSFEAGYLSLVCRWLSAGVYDYNDASVASSGSWSTTLYSAVDPPYGSGLGMSYSSSAGAGKTITIPTAAQAKITAAGGAWVHLNFVTAYGDSACVIAATVNGTAYGSKTIRAQFWPDNHGLDTYRIWCPAGTTTVAFTITTATAGAVRFDGWSIEASVTPVVALLEMVLPSAPPGIWSSIDQTVCDAYNTRIDTVVAAFTTPGVTGSTSVASVFKVDGLNTALGEGDSLYFADGLHPNELGSARVAQTIAGKIQALLADGTIDREQVNAWWYGELEPLTSYEFELARGDGDPLELIDGFNRDNENSLSTAGWTAVSGGWGVLNNELALTGDKFPYPDFTDAFGTDGAPSLWTQTVGTWVISGDEIAHTVTANGMLTSPNPLVSGDGWIEYTAAGTVVTGSGFFFRYSDANNFWRATWNSSTGAWAVVEKIAGVDGTPTVVHSGDFADGNTYAINLSGTTMSFFVNGSPANTAPTVTSSLLENATGCGLRSATAGSAYRWANWRQGTSPVTTSDDPTFNLVTRDFGATTGALGFTVGADQANFSGIVFRYVDKDNWLSLYQSTSYGAWVFVKCISGSVTTVTGTISGSMVAGTTVVVKMVSSTTFRFYFNGVECSQGLQTVADAPAGTVYGFRANYGTDVPTARFDSVLAGTSYTVVPDGQWYRNDQTGEQFGPFEDGVPNDSVPWLPTDTSAAGLDEVIRDRVGTALVAGSGMTVTVNDGADTITLASSGGGGTVDVVSNVATSTILGRTTAGTGDSEELTPSAARTLLDVPSNAEAMLDSLIDAAGDIVVGTADNTPSRLAIGADRRHLVSTGTAPVWEAGGVTLIAETVLSGNATSIAFTSIPATYRHLMVVAWLRTDLANTVDQARIYLNADTTAANYDSLRADAANAGITVTQNLGSYIGGSMTTGATSPANQFAQVVGYVPNYAQAQYKLWTASGSAWCTRSAAGIVDFSRSAGWANTAAVTAFTFTPHGGNNFVSGSRVSLYGIG